MPVKFNFTERKSGEIMTLDEIDKRICEDLKGDPECYVPYDPNRYCPMYQWITLIGLARAIRPKDSNTIDRGLLAQHLIDEYPDAKGSQLKLILKYLVDDYVYDAWR